MTYLHNHAIQIIQNVFQYMVLQFFYYYSYNLCIIIDKILLI